MKRMTFQGLITVPVLLVLLCVPSVASANGITWNLVGVTFNDGGGASGSFFYDAGSNMFSAIDIITTTGSAFPGATYMALGTAGGSSNTGMILGASGNLTNTDLLLLMFGADLTNSGGTVSLLTGSLTGSVEGTCDNADCSSSTPDRTITAGNVVATPVTTPEPSTLLLLGMGVIVSLAGAAIRKVSHA